MARFIDADKLIEQYGLNQATKYGNESKEQQSFSYSTMMMYEIYDMIDDAPTEDVVPIVRCKDCKHWKDSDGVYRRGFDAESKCPINIEAVYNGTFYCARAEKMEESGKQND